MKENFTVKSLASGKEFNISYEYMEKMQDREIMSDGISLGFQKEVYIKEELFVEFNGNMYKGFIHKLFDLDTGKAAEICRECEADTYIRASVGDKYLLVVLGTDDIAKFDEIKTAASDPEVRAYKKAEHETMEAERKTSAEEIIREAEKTVRNEDGSLMSDKEARAWKKRYNDFYNEGGEGFVPNVVTAEAFEWANKILNENLN